jgi:hypothetical protein
VSLIKIKLTSVLVFTGFSLVYGQDIIIHVPVEQPRLMEVDAGEDITANDPGTVILGQDMTVVGGTPEYMYKWTDPEHSVHEGRTLQGQTFGTYHLEVSDEKHCTAFDSVKVINGTFILPRKETAFIAFFPNPSSGTIYFDGSGFGETITVEWINNTGETLFRKQILNSGDHTELAVPMDMLWKGAFMLRLSDSHTSRAGLVIIQ